MSVLKSDQEHRNSGEGRNAGGMKAGRMKIVFKLYAMLARYLPPEARNNQVEIDINAQTSVSDIIKRYGLPEALTHLVLVNGHYVAPADRDQRHLSAGDHLAVWPPIAGG